MADKFHEIANMLRDYNPRGVKVSGDGSIGSAIDYLHTWSSKFDPILLHIFVRSEREITIKINWPSKGAQTPHVANNFTEAMNEIMRLNSEIQEILERPGESPE